jgi:hypothetical protein
MSQSATQFRNVQVFQSVDVMFPHCWIKELHTVATAPCTPFKINPLLLKNVQLTTLTGYDESRDETVHSESSQPFPANTEFAALQCAAISPPVLQVRLRNTWQRMNDTPNAAAPSPATQFDMTQSTICIAECFPPAM